MNPAALCAGYDALCTEDDAILAAIQRIQSCLDLGQAKLLMGLHAPSGKDFICMMVLMVMTAAAMTVFMMMLVVMSRVISVSIFLAMEVLIFVMMVLMLHPGKFCFHRSLAFHGFQQLSSGELVPGSRHKCGGSVGILKLDGAYYVGGTSTDKTLGKNRFSGHIIRKSNFPGKPLNTQRTEDK